jgi:DNA helicase-2/ATP-dependent DNA helicase PcrA
MFEEFPDTSFAILVRESRQGQFVANLLRDPDQVGVDLPVMGLRIYDVGAEDRQTQVPEDMLTLMKFIERPHSPDYLKSALRVLVDRKKSSYSGSQCSGQCPGAIPVSWTAGHPHLIQKRPERLGDIA